MQESVDDPVLRRRMRNVRHSADTASPVWPQICGTCRAGDCISSSQESKSEWFHPCLFSPLLSTTLGCFFLSPSMTCKVCLFRQLVSPLKIILFYATHNETCLSVKKHTCAFLCPASRQPIRYFSDEQLDVGLQTNIPFFRERLSYVGIAVVWAWLGTLVAFHPVASACCISGNFFGC